MNVFYVDVLIQMGEYEKNVTSFREAETSEDACYAALCGETHNKALTRAEFDAGNEWWDDYMVYSVRSVYQVPEQLAIELVKANKWPMTLIH
ncbi:hypothetical protein [Vibrio owensii]|uniref:hypothetical protein n=1 Tax=Vibrio owensii TaxID=696485 RepID=UPI0040676745